MFSGKRFDTIESALTKIAEFLFKKAEMDAAQCDTIKSTQVKTLEVILALDAKLTDIQQLNDKLNTQAATLCSVTYERDKYQRQLEDAQGLLQQVEVQLSDEKLSNAKLLTEIESLRQKLVMSQAESNLATATATAVKQAPQPAGFNIQELANELSKYLTAPAVVEDTGLPTVKLDNANTFQNFAPPAPSTGMGQDYSAPVMPTAPAGDAPVRDSVGAAASLLQPRSYIPSPGSTEPDALLADNIHAADPEVLSRIPRTTGPVLLPSQAQYAYQVAELVAEGAQYLPPVPTVPTQG